MSAFLFDAAEPMSVKEIFSVAFHQYKISISIKCLAARMSMTESVASKQAMHIGV